ncbi:hypothetical protein C0Q70_07716 [Pomacea canaliculata]|uniref:Uncharacterized protein n=1 Tax=Pomacea canaliculata TaxID=400727 RepID=A0A2T7PFS9_POMCA|nr:hypothetical protein C0Q70_07716 [Pomacea canaliculata]
MDDTNRTGQAVHPTHGAVAQLRLRTLLRVSPRLEVSKQILFPLMPVSLYTEGRLGTSPPSGVCLLSRCGCERACESGTARDDDLVHDREMHFAFGFPCHRRLNPSAAPQKPQKPSLVTNRHHLHSLP